MSLLYILVLLYKVIHVYTYLYTYSWFFPHVATGTEGSSHGRRSMATQIKPASSFTGRTVSWIGFGTNGGVEYMVNIWLMMVNIWLMMVNIWLMIRGMGWFRYLWLGVIGISMAQGYGNFRGKHKWTYGDSWYFIGVLEASSSWNIGLNLWFALKMEVQNRPFDGY